MTRNRWLGAMCLALGLTSVAQARVYDTMFRGNFDFDPNDTAATDADAARFLTQATFGPTTAEIAKVRSLGYSLWIDQQLAKSPTLARPFMDQVSTAMTAGGQTIGHNQRLDRWFWTAAYAPDQLRQRMAYSLSQIFVISDQNGTLAGEPIQTTEYYDLLTRDAFGLYRTLLDDVTWNPSMGKYLTHFRNRGSPGHDADENYAREILQLFSIGLIERDDSFTALTDANGPIPTYDQNVITNFAKLFTGFNYADATNIFNGTNTYLHMSCIAAEHNATAKQVLGGLIIAAGQSCATDVSDGLNIISSHANVPSSIARQLIERYTSSNPSPAYIQRVAMVFKNNGFAERGDLGSVLKAILTDPEARAAPTTNSGKVREPLLRLTALWRAWDAVAPAPTSFGEVLMGMTNPMPTYGQRPLGAATVFNFYEPDYQQPGPIEDANLYSPELQIINEGSAYTISNSLYTYTWNSYVGMTNPPTTRPLINLAPLTALVANPAAMVELANQRMLYGSMTTNTRNTLTSMITFMGTSPPTGGGATATEKALSLIHLVAISPEASVQR
jgi:uncharacterized protein (DUF1800 family)